MHCAAPSSGSGLKAMRKVAIIAALEREIGALIAPAKRIEGEYQGRKFTFFERGETVMVCGGIGVEAARRAAEAVIALYRPEILQSVGFAGALQSDLRVGDLFMPSVVLDARDGSRTSVGSGTGILLTFMSVAGAAQKSTLAQAYGAQAIDMEAAAVAAAARAHGIAFGATKVISDGLNFEMPDMSRFIDIQGRFKTAAFAAYVAVRPWLWGRAGELACNSSQAAKALAAHLSQSSDLASGMIEAKTM
jgi:adenosylhomocysteine nucleosidase